MAGVRPVASRPDRRRYRRNQGQVRLCLWGFQARPPDGHHRLPVPGGRVAAQGDRVGRPRPAAAPGQADLVNKRLGPVRSHYGCVFRCTITAMNPLSGVLGEAWQMYKKFAGHLLAIAFVIYLAAAVIAALLALAGRVGVGLGSLVQIIAAFLLQATLVKAVQDVRDGRVDLSLGETVRAATPYLWAVAGASILAGIAITIGLILLIVP